MSQAIKPTAVFRPVGWQASHVSDLRAVSTGTLIASGVRLLALGAQLMLSFACAHILGAAGTGELFLATTVVWITAVLARLGLDSVVLRQIAVHRVNACAPGMRG